MQTIALNQIQSISVQSLSDLDFSKHCHRYGYLIHRLIFRLLHKILGPLKTLFSASSSDYYYYLNTWPLT